MQKKVFRIFLVTLFTTVFVLGVFTTANSTQAYAASKKTSVQPSIGDTKLPSEPSWIIKAEPYVHISNGIATVDPAIKKVLSSDDVSLVMHAIKKYNTISHAPKTNMAAINTSIPKSLVPNASCPSGSGRVYGPYTYWWGHAITLNHCLIQQLWTAVYVLGTEATVITLVCAAATAGACALFAAISGAYIAATVKALNDADAQCGNRGANLNFTFGVPIPWVNAVC